MKSIKASMADSGWAGNSINAVIFRKNALSSIGHMQFIAFYNSDGKVVIGKRSLGKKRWKLKETNFTGNIKDAHNSISIMADGNGYLHMAWNHHNNALHYTRSRQPYSLEMMDEMPMNGELENRVTYPEFFRMPDGSLLFFYRDGQSGRGNLVMKKYDLQKKAWETLHSNLIDGEGKRNAYWQACVDNSGTVHLSWVWRESANVSTNHDMCYARSKDGGRTWQKSDGSIYTLPIHINSAEYAAYIPQNSDLINQTSMTSDEKGNPYIATYWRDTADTRPRYKVVWHTGDKWQVLHSNAGDSDFSLSGMGTKSIPISRPQLLVWGKGSQPNIALLYRDRARDSKASLALFTPNGTPTWKIVDVQKTLLGDWEPCFDTNLWQRKRRVHLYAQIVVQVDGEGLADFIKSPVNVWEWKMKK